MDQTQQQPQLPAQLPGYISSHAMDPFFQLRRDWEHAFHIQSVKGQGTDHLQQLMHSQFTFLEHVVLGNYHF